MVGRSYYVVMSRSMGCKIHADCQRVCLTTPLQQLSRCQRYQSSQLTFLQIVTFVTRKKSAVQRVAVSKRSRAFLYQDRKIIKIVAKISGKTKVSLIKSKNARRDAQNCTV